MIAARQRSQPYGSIHSNPPTKADPATKSVWVSAELGSPLQSQILLYTIGCYHTCYYSPKTRWQPGHDIWKPATHLYTVYLRLLASSYSSCYRTWKLPWRLKLLQTCPRVCPVV